MPFAYPRREITNAVNTKAHKFHDFSFFQIFGLFFFQKELPREFEKKQLRIEGFVKLQISCVNFVNRVN